MRESNAKTPRRQGGAAARGRGAGLLALVDGRARRTRPWAPWRPGGFLLWAAIILLTCGTARAQTQTAHVIPLTVKEAILRALKNNPDVEIARLQVSYAVAGVGAQQGAFDPDMYAAASYARRRDPFFALNPFGTGGVNPITGLPSGLAVNPSDIGLYDAGVKQTTPLGTAWQVEYDMNRRTSEAEFSLPHQWQPTAQVTITQPLFLKNWGIDSNMAYVTIARRQADQTREQFSDQAMTTAFAVEQAYWAYVYAVENRKVAEQALATAKDLVDINRKKLEVGKLAPIEVLVAETGVANREDAVIQSRTAVDDARDQLLRLTEPPGSARAWDVDLVAVDTPRATEADIIDVERAIDVALARRPDMRGLTYAIDADRARVDRTSQDTLPSLNVVGSFSENGLGSSHHNSNAAMLNGDFYDWSIGLTIDFPLFNEAALAAEYQAEIALRQDRKRVEALELGIVLDVRTAVRDLLAAKERIRATDKAAELSARQVDEQRKRLEVGLITNYDVLLVEQDLTQALVNSVKAKTDYAIALARLARVTGRSLDRHEIRIEDAD